MNRLITHLPLLVTISICATLVAHGPIPQLAHYHEFADQSRLLGIPHAADVLSNIGFALAAIWGLIRLRHARKHPALRLAWPGYGLFLIGLLLTAFGSSYYHLAPDNARLIWDRLPIALACAGLLAGVRAETVPSANGAMDAILLGLFAVASVAWWYITDRDGAGDLRPYLLLQGLPLVLVPMWQAIWHAPRRDRMAFGIALLLYVIAKVAELNDHALLDMLGVVSGHTLKHFLASVAAGVIVVRLAERISADCSAIPHQYRYAVSHQSD